MLYGPSSVAKAPLALSCCFEFCLPSTTLRRNSSLKRPKFMLKGIWANPITSDVLRKICLGSLYPIFSLLGPLGPFTILSWDPVNSPLLLLHVAFVAPYRAAVSMIRSLDRRHVFLFPQRPLSWHLRSQFAFFHVRFPGHCKPNRREPSGRTICG